MIFFKRLTILLYMAVLLISGGVILVLAADIVPVQTWAELAEKAGSELEIRITLACVGVFFLLAGLIGPANMNRRMKRGRVVAFQNPDGEVTVSLSAIEEYIKKIARGISGIKDVKSHVSINKRGVNISTAVSISTGVNIPEMTEKIQMEVKNKVRSMLGVEGRINMKIHINKILRGGSEPAGNAPEAVEETTIPFREM